MKNAFKISVHAFASNLAFAQTASEKTLSVHFKNNSILPHHYTFVSYEAGQSNNSTVGKFLWPFGSYNLKAKAGTTLYLANSEQINTVMSGSRIFDKPFFVFTEKDGGKIINLLNN